MASKIHTFVLEALRSEVKVLCKFVCVNSGLMMLQRVVMWVDAEWQQGREVLRPSRKPLLGQTGGDWIHKTASTSAADQRHRGVLHNVAQLSSNSPLPHPQRRPTCDKTSKCQGCSGENKSLAGRVCACGKWRSWRAAACALQWAFCPAESSLGTRLWRRNFSGAGWRAALASLRRICSDISDVSTPLSFLPTAGNGWSLVSWQIPFALAQGVFIFLAC